MNRTIITHSVWVAQYPVTTGFRRRRFIRQPASISVYNDDSLEIVSAAGLTLLQTALTQLENVNDYYQTLEFDTQGNHYVIFFIKPPSLWRIKFSSIFFMPMFIQRAHEAAAPTIQQLFAILQKLNVPVNVARKQGVSGIKRAIMLGLAIGLGLVVAAIIALIIYGKTATH